ncbi:NADH dehydrogenase FAD-containing subunit [Kushneria sinocarnis]|uniref:NADH dehydrogenase FAD-containing subunit n=1 Tax=Kushneria sinocarnis TaxID=595502 RepID=A0A420WVR1_9GAMM|nr:NAD(P)/FAD-dependent oxidoreductase [Kushneria sinocarnis]RKR02650.1 NADH dehydrogenase FAD-containing subunit [Kushneria sinocarnis]
MSVPRIVVVGGGAGGFELATRLGRRLGRRNRAEIILVDRNPTHIWKPLLHEVATGALDQGLDEVSYQAHARTHGYRYQLGTLSGLDRDSRRITLAPLHDEKGEVVLGERTLDYDYLVLSVGSVSNDFGTPGVADHCYFLDSTQQAETFRRAMLNTFLRYSDPAHRDRSHLSVAIVGGGATGVELSAELHNATRMLNSYGYSEIDSNQLQIHLIEAAPRILPALPERIGESARRELDKLGVQIHTDTRITSADERGFDTADDRRIDADLTVWAAGVRAPEILSELGLSTQRNHQVRVHQTMQSIDDERIFALGDCAACPQGEEKMVPPRAQAAHQMANTLYGNLVAAMNDRPLKNFHYRDMGSLISLAHFDAVGNVMRGASTRGLFVEGALAKLFYASLYRMHQRAIHGSFRTMLKIMVDRLNNWLRPRLKLH